MDSVANARAFDEFIPETYLLSAYDQGIAVIEDQDESELWVADKGETTGMY